MQFSGKPFRGPPRWALTKGMRSGVYRKKAFNAAAFSVLIVCSFSAGLRKACAAIMASRINKYRAIIKVIFVCMENRMPPGGTRMKEWRRPAAPHLDAARQRLLFRMDRF